MITFYVDVYFLLNFIIDIISLHFSALFVKIDISIIRLLSASAALSLYGVITVLLDIGILSIPVSVFVIMLVGAFCAPKSGLCRKLKTSLAFFVFQTLLGGVVYFGYCLFEKIFSELNFENETDVNRKIIILALFVFFAITVIKIISLIFSNTLSETNVNVICEYEGKKNAFSALVDTGNLATDPLDGTPVMFVTKKLFEKIFKFTYAQLEDAESLKYDVKKRIRIIPISESGKTKAVFGIKMSDVYISKKEKKEQVSVIIAVFGSDSFGDHFALVPFSLVRLL